MNALRTGEKIGHFGQEIECRQVVGALFLSWLMMQFRARRRFIVAAWMLMALLDGRSWAQGFIAAEGGGLDPQTPWSAELMGWMVENARGGAREGANGGASGGAGGGAGRETAGPRVVVLGAIPLSGPDERLEAFRKAGASEAVALVVNAGNADDEATYDALTAAQIIFIRGGDQSRYVRWWRGTRTERAIREVFARGGVIGGTSAGCAILGEVSYDANRGSLSGPEALADARHENLSLSCGFLGLAPGVLFDTHFAERARLPRLALMLAHARERAVGDAGWPRALLGLGVDPRTAVCISPDGTAEIRGEGAVTLLRLSERSEVTLAAGKPPSISFVECSQFTAGYRIDTRTGRVLARPEFVKPTGMEARDAAARRQRTVMANPFVSRKTHELMRGIGRDAATALVVGIAANPEHLRWSGDRRLELALEAAGAAVILDCAARTYGGVTRSEPGLGAFEGAVLHLVAPGEAFVVE